MFPTPLTQHVAAEKAADLHRARWTIRRSNRGARI
jgi:hypothetical protein